MQWTQKLYFLRMKDMKLPIIIILGHRGVWDNVKTGLRFLYIFCKIWFFEVSLLKMYSPEKQMG